ncbi:MAG: branched-chain amino acid ABC transporter permease [Polaromonas sp.]|nr:branched-chain amino acid ABC transporter permease [Polaromonas sp.]
MSNNSLDLKITYCVIALAITLPAWLYPILLAQLACMALFACSLNLLFGYAGLLSFGHAAFFGISAYATGYLTKAMGFTPELAILFALVLVMFIAFIFGSLAIRRKGIYFSMITLALSQLVYFIIVAAPFSHNEDGYQGVPRGAFLGLLDLTNDYVVYYFVLAIVIFTWWCIYRVVQSPYGEVLKAIKDNEQRVISLGYNVNQYKILAFTLSAGVAAIAGGLKTVVFGLASLSDVHWHLSTDGVIMMILGGIGSIIAPVFGAIIMVLIQHLLSGEFYSLVPVIMGVIFVACVLAFRGGVIQYLQRLMQMIVRK